MESLHDLLTIVSIFRLVHDMDGAFLFVVISITSISSKCDYWFKMIALYLYFGFTACLIIPFGIISQNPIKSHQLWSDLVRQASIFLPLRWKTIGRENVDQKQPYVVVCNHQTGLDVLASAHIWPSLDKCVMVAKKELKYAGPFGLCLTLCGTIFLDRGSSESGRRAINEAGKKAKASGTSMFLFPEGTRNSAGGGQLLPFKKGAFHVALDIGVPILPVVVSEYDFLGPSRSDKFAPGDVTIQILPPVRTEGVTKDQIDALIKKTRDPMIEALKSMQKKQE